MKRENTLALTIVAAFVILGTMCERAHAGTPKAGLSAGAAFTPEPYCRRGCNTNNGECWTVLATYEENIASDGQAPLLVTHKVYIGEPYWSAADAMCGASRLRKVGICVAEVMATIPSKVEVVKSDGSEPTYPGFADCY